MKPIPTTEEIRAQWFYSNNRESIDFTHSILAPLIEEARNAQQPEPWGEGHRLLVPWKDVWQDGDEHWDSTAKEWRPTDLGGSNYVKNEYSASIGRRPLRNPWRSIKDAPPEHMGADVIVGGGVTWLTSNIRLGTQEPHRTHYMLLSDIPPVPQEPEPDDGFDAWWKDNWLPYCNEVQARKIWTAARKESK